MSKRKRPKKATAPAKAARKKVAIKTKVARPAPKPTWRKKRSAPLSPERPSVSKRGLAQDLEELRARIDRSKISSPSPYDYASKARGWRDRVAALATEVARCGEYAKVKLAALAGRYRHLVEEIEGDADFLAAARLI